MNLSPRVPLLRRWAATGTISNQLRPLYLQLQTFRARLINVASWPIPEVRVIPLAAVVDAQLRDHDKEGLLIIDGSMTLKPIGVNTNAPTIMIAEKAAEMIQTSESG